MQGLSTPRLRLRRCGFSLSRLHGIGVDSPRDARHVATDERDSVAVGFRNSSTATVAARSPARQTRKHVPPSKDMLMAILNATQFFCIMTVLGVHVGTFASRKQQREQGLQRKRVQLAPSTSRTVKTVNQTSFFGELAPHQPLFIALGMACALLANIRVKSREAPDAHSPAVTPNLRKEVDVAVIRDNMRLMDRKLAKIQSRVLVCTEQYRAMRVASNESQSTVNDVLTMHGTALAEIQEQANSLQKVVSSMQDVVVKQIQVMTPPIKKLNHRVNSLEDEVASLKALVASQQQQEDPPSHPTGSVHVPRLQIPKRNPTDDDDDHGAGQGRSTGEPTTAIPPSSTSTARVPHAPLVSPDDTEGTSSAAAVAVHTAVAPKDVVSTSQECTAQPSRSHAHWGGEYGNGGDGRVQHVTWRACSGCITSCSLIQAAKHREAMTRRLDQICSGYRGSGRKGSLSTPHMVRMMQMVAVTERGREFSISANGPNARPGLRSARPNMQTSGGSPRDTLHGVIWIKPAAHRTKSGCGAVAMQCVPAQQPPTPRTHRTTRTPRTPRMVSAALVKSELLALRGPQAVTPEGKVPSSQSVCQTDTSGGMDGTQHSVGLAGLLVAAAFVLDLLWTLPVMSGSL